MQEYGGFTIKMGSEEQATIAKSIVLEYCEDEWEKALKQNGAILEVDQDTHIHVYDYPGKVEAICQKIAQKHPDFSFTVEASGGEDEGCIYSSREHGKLENGIFKYVQIEEVPIEPPEGYEADDGFNYDEWMMETLGIMMTKEITTTGKLVDGIMRFTETVITVDEE